MEPTVRYACVCRIVGIFGGYVVTTPRALDVCMHLVVGTVTGYLKAWNLRES